MQFHWESRRALWTLASSGQCARLSLYSRNNSILTTIGRTQLSQGSNWSARGCQAIVHLLASLRLHRLLDTLRIRMNLLLFQVILNIGACLPNDAAKVQILRPEAHATASVDDAFGDVLPTTILDVAPCRRASSEPARLTSLCLL